MSKRYKLTIISMFLDILIYVTCYMVVLSVRSLSATIFLDINLPFVTVSSLFLITLFANSGIYRRIWSKTSGNDIIYIVRSTALVFAVALVINLIISPRPMPLSVLIVFHMLALSGFVLVRYRSRLFGALQWRYRAVWLREFPETDYERVLIVGAGNSGQHTALRFRQNTDDNYKYKVIGFLDDDPDKIGMKIENCEVLGATDDMISIVKDYRIDLIVFAIHNISGPEFRRILGLCQDTEARIKIVPDPFKLMEQKISTPPLRDVTPEDLIGRSIVSKHKNVDLSPVSNRIVMVTGAAGSIGSEISRQMLDYEPTKLIVVDNNESALHDLHIELKALHTELEIVPCLVDVSQYNQLQSIYQKYTPSIVFHAAAYKHVPMLERYPNAAIKVNIGGTLNAVELALLNGIERFVLVSTDKAVDPTSVMGASKRICEQIVHAVAQTHDYGTQFTTVRFGNVLGSRGSVVPTFNRQIDQGGPVTVTHPEMTRYFMSISEATNLVIHAAALTTGDDVFVLRMGEVVKIVDLAERMIRLRGLRPNIDIPIVFTGIRPGEKLHEQLYELNEDPQSTKHPYITKIGSIHLNGNSGEFMTRLRVIVRDGVRNEENALQELRQLIKISEVAQSEINDEMVPIIYE
jgi:FlaA1/EpsC-like NDP-sugar epimerase